jgi:hypothetical protein
VPNFQFWCLWNTNIVFISRVTINNFVSDKKNMERETVLAFTDRFRQFSSLAMSWMRDRRSWVTSCGGWHLGHRWAQGRELCCWHGCRLVGHVYRTRGTRMEYATRRGYDGWASKPPSATVTGFARFGPQNLVVWFQRESRAACGVITEGASKRSNFVKITWPSDLYYRSWSILP